MSDLFIHAVGTGVLAYSRGVGQQDGESLMLATRMAHRATHELYPAGGVQWFRYFQRQLRFYGADGRLADFPEQLVRVRKPIVARMLETLQAQNAERFEAMAVEALAAVARSRPAVHWVETHANTYRRGIFQLLACQPGQGSSGASLLDLMVYQEEMIADSSGRGFFTFGGDATPLARLGLVRFNGNAFRAAYQASLEKRFEKIQEDYFTLLG